MSNERVIKFRAWDGEKMQTDFTVARPQYADCLSIMTDETFAQNTYKVKEWKVMQFTGLHDKNGKEIYEGDIVRYSILDLEFAEDATIYTEEVHFENGGFELDNAPLGAFHEECEIIGNIHQNPDPL